MTLSFFSGRKPATQTSPHVEPACVGVNVTVTERDGHNDGLEWNPDQKLAAQIRADLPNQPVSENLRAARIAAVLDKQAAFLADRSGKVEPPERWEVVEACRFAAEHIRDGIVIGSAA